MTGVQTCALPISILGYKIERSTNNTTWTVITANTNSAVPATVQSGLTNGTQYWFRISVVTAGGNGVAASPVAVTPYTVPTAPVSLVASPRDGEIGFTWSAPVSDGGATITDYQVETSTDGGASWTATIPTTGGATAATITGLTNGVAILVRVSAYNIAGWGSPTASVSAAAYTVPDVPTALSGVGQDSSVLLSWTAPAANNGSPISGYMVERSADGGVTWTTAIANTGNSGTNAVVTGLTNGTAYAFRVSAINAAGAGNPAASAAVTPRTTPSAPTAVATTIGSGTVTVAWSAPVSNGGATVSSYTAQRSTDGGVTWTTRATGLTASPYVDSGLTNGTTYVYRVIANNIAGAGAPSAGVAAVPAAKPGAPTALVATGASGSAVLSWTPPADTGGTAILGYRIEMSIDTGSTQLDANGNTVDADPWTVVVANSGTASPYAVVNGLNDGQRYDFRVSAINVAGTGTASASDDATPIVTSTVVLSGTAANASANLTWTAPTDVTASDYVVERSTDGVTWASAMTNPGGSAVSGTASGLTNGTLYFFRIQVLVGGVAAGTY